MLGTGLQVTRARGEDRFYNPARARRAHQNQKPLAAEQLRLAQSDVTPTTTSQSPPVKGSRRNLNWEPEPENRAVLNVQRTKPAAVPAGEPVAKLLSNLERFLQSVTPSVPAQHLSMTTMRGMSTCDVEFQPYFVLGDLWESIKEWSACGAEVPLILNGSDSAVQYYVPYPAAIQIYGSSSEVSKTRYPIYRIPTGPTLKDLDTCFLSYHFLSNPVGGVQDPRAPVVTYPSDMEGTSKMLLPVFGLASYKFRGSLWTPSGGLERQLATSLLQATDDFLKLRQVNHPDFMFFSRR